MTTAQCGLIVDVNRSTRDKNRPNPTTLLKHRCDARKSLHNQARSPNDSQVEDLFSASAGNSSNPCESITAAEAQLKPVFPESLCFHAWNITTMSGLDPRAAANVLPHRHRRPFSISNVVGDVLVSFKMELATFFLPHNSPHILEN